jgi:hypothetical protein
MTPQEKAIVLVHKFDNCMEFSTPQRFAKQCALIAVDEIINETSPLELHPLGTYTNPKIEYWEQVKQEIEKL